MRPQIVKILTIMLFLLNSFYMLGQSSSAKSGPPPPPQRTPQLPIDTNIYILIVAGILLGIYVVLKNKRAKSTLQ